MTPSITVICGGSGSGKSTLLQRLKHEGFPTAISAVTRKPRAGEVDGVDYHFWSQEVFLNHLRNGFLIEWEEIHGNFYGLPVRSAMSALASSKPAFVVMDPNGAINLHNWAAANHIRMSAIWLDVNQELQVQMLARRVQADVAAGSELNEAITAHSLRAAQAMSLESEWRHAYQWHQVVQNDFDQQSMVRAVERAIVAAHSATVPTTVITKREAAPSRVTSELQDRISRTVAMAAAQFSGATVTEQAISL